MLKIFYSGFVKVQKLFEVVYEQMIPVIRKKINYRYFYRYFKNISHEWGFLIHPDGNSCPSKAYILRITSNYTVMHDRHNYWYLSFEGQSYGERSFSPKNDFS